MLVLDAEQQDDSNLLVIFERQRQVQDLIEAQAQLLYRTRAIWIGDRCLPWGLLTDGQRKTYKREVELLIKEVR